MFMKADSSTNGERRSDRRWQSVRDWLLHRIRTGVLASGARLPSVRQLALSFRTSIGTVQRALRDLEINAHVRSVPKVGYFVTRASVQDRDDAAGRAGALTGVETGSGMLTSDELAGVSVNVNQSVVQMLAAAACRNSAALNSAVLDERLTPHVLLDRCLVALGRSRSHALHGLVSPPGLLALRRRIAGLMKDRGVQCGPDDVLVTSGDTVALELALMTVAGAGATVAIEVPTYYGMLQVIERLDMKALPIPMDPEEGVDVEMLARAVRRGHVDVIYLNPTLHNPLGSCMPDHRRKALAEVLVDTGVPVIEDDIFFDLVPRESRVSAIKNLLPHQTIYCSSFSKTLAPGYRVGWCIPGKYSNEMLAQLFARNLSVSSISQAVLAEFLGRRYLDEHGRRLRSCFQRNIDFMARFVRASFPIGTVYRPPAGGFIHWLELPDGVDMARLRERVARRGLFLADSSIFFPDNRRSQGVRLCIGRPLDDETRLTLHVLAECARQCCR